MMWEATWLRTRLRSYPVRLCVESTGACNLSCPHCFTGAGEIGRPRRAVSSELYHSLLTELGDYLWQVEFCNWGEPLLNRETVPMIAAAAQRGISTLICTNFSVPFDAARAEALVASGLHVLGVSIDGARQETYEQYRVGGVLDTVLRNCANVVEAKRRLGRSTPRLIWAYHVFPFNREDVEPARNLATGLGMDFHASRGRVVGEDWDPDA
jgi:MoaA/NifB/PqqE/SkfB family radical SAM enzyme